MKKITTSKPKDEAKEPACKKGNHYFTSTSDPRYLKCEKCPLVRVVHR